MAGRSNGSMEQWLAGWPLQWLAGWPRAGQEDPSVAPQKRRGKAVSVALLQIQVSKRGGKRLLVDHLT